MPDCDYCDRSFADEDAYLSHLGAEHEAELGRIDRRRVESHRSDDGIDVPPIVYYAAGSVALFLLSAGVVYYAVGAFSSEGIVHEHGTIEVVIDGERVDLHQYSNEREAFHFHPGDPQWHMEPREPGRLTLSDGLSRLGIELTEDRLVLDDETYDATEEGTSLAVTVNGEPVDPETYELHDGDHVEIVVESGD